MVRSLICPSARGVFLTGITLVFPALAGEFLTTGPPGHPILDLFCFIYLTKIYTVFTVYQAMMLNIFHHLDVLLLGNTNLGVSVFRYRL